MVFEEFAVEGEEALFEALEVVVIDAREVGGEVIGEHDISVIMLILDIFWVTRPVYEPRYHVRESTVVVKRGNGYGDIHAK